MDMFDRVANQTGGANIRTISFNSSNNGSRASNNQRQKPVPPSPKPMEIMSDDALNNLDATLQKKFQKARDSRERNAIQNQLYAIQDELAKRKAVEDNKPVAVVSPKEQEKIKGIGYNVGASALIFGVLGFLIGATTTKPKSAILWGVAGATMGGLGAFFMSQEESGIKVIQ
jgi:hypothetical protein